MYGNVDAELLWLRLLAKYLVEEYNLKRSKAYSSVFFTNDKKGMLELVMLVHVEDVFMSGRLETLKKNK